MIAERIVRVLVGLVVAVWVAKYMGPTNLGDLGFAVAFLSLCGCVSNLGLETVVVRGIARDPTDSAPILGTALVLRVASSIAVFSLGALSLVAIAKSSHQLQMVALVAIASLLFQPVEVFDYWFQANLTSRLTVISRVVALVVTAIAKILLILMSAPVLAFAGAIVLENAAFGAAMCINFWWHPGPRPVFSRDQARTLLADALPMLLSNLAIIMYMRLDQILLRELAGARQSGLFSAILPFTEGWYFIAATASTSLLPTFIRIHGGDRVRSLKHLKTMSTVMLAISVLIALTMTALSPAIVDLFLGASFREAVPVMRIHCWAVVFVFLGVTENLWLVAGNFRRIRIGKTIAGTVANIGLNFLLIPPLGATGAAIATIVSFAVATVLSNVVLAPELFRMQASMLSPWKRYVA